MATTLITDVQTAALYQKLYQLEVARKLSYALWCWDWSKGQPGARLGGTTINRALVTELEPNVTALSTVGGDVTPTAMSDALGTVTPHPYGDAVQLDDWVEEVAVIEDWRRVAAEVTARACARSLNRLARAQAVAGTRVVYQTGATTAEQTAAGVVDLAFMKELFAVAVGQGMRPFDDGMFRTVVHPWVAADIQGDSDFMALGEYQRAELIEQFVVGRLGGIEVLMDPDDGYMKFGQGATGNGGADTLNGAVSAGDTTVTVTDNAGNLTAKAGDWVTLDPGAATEEVVKVTAVATHVLTIQGAGNSQTNEGLKYAHSNGATINNKVHVAVLPVYDPQSIAVVYGTTGRWGEHGTSGPFDVALRYQNWFWKFYGGFGRPREKRMLRGEAGCSMGAPLA